MVVPAAQPLNCGIAQSLHRAPTAGLPATSRKLCVHSPHLQMQAWLGAPPHSISAVGLHRSPLAAH